MITGFNTDIRHRDVVLHVQTEDKGESNPCVESLVYVGGQILARKQSGYRDLLDQDGGKEAIVKEAIVELMEHQHRSMIDEIRRGKLDERLISMGAMSSSAPPAEAVEEPPAKVAADAAPSLDQVILDYLSSETSQEQLVLAMETEGELAPGREAVLSLEARTSRADEPVPEAAVSVKMISTLQEPVELAAGQTDERGRLVLRVSLPDIGGGAAALIVRATSSVGAAEIKQLI